MNNLLLVGGAGYIGSVLANYFLKKKYISKIYILDNLIYKNQKICDDLKKNKKIIFIKNDFNNKQILSSILPKVNFVIMLAGLVGDPITKKYPLLSKKNNDFKIQKFLKNLKNFKNVERFVFISTCSNYGILKDKIADEKSKLNPKSTYAKAKVKIEKILLKKRKVNYATTILRFATAFGLSPRMRYDLTLNQFCREALRDKKIEIYDSMTWRPYCHVHDFSRIIERVLLIDKKIINRQVFNAGLNSNNSRKIDIAKKIQKKIKKLKIIKVKGTQDPRDYRVSFKKLSKVLNIKPRLTINDGIIEIIKSLKKGKNNSRDNGNFVIRKSI